MNIRAATLSLIALALVLLPAGAAAASDESAGDGANAELWYPATSEAVPSVALYFVYSETCPHCTNAKPYVEYLEDTYDWLEVRRVSTQEATDLEIDQVMTLAHELGTEITGVPAFLFCERMEVGYGSADTTGAFLEESVLSCRASLVAGAANAAPPTTEEDNEDQLNVPVLGDIDAQAVSLPLFTVAVAGLDAFNPCAFFVLLFLLSLLVHAKSRWRMALVGGVFVVISGVMYFAFMAAWLNVFLVTGQLRWVTTVAGGIAVALAIMNVKDYFWPESAGSISIPDSAKPGLFARMRQLTTGDSLPAVLAGTVALAIVANSYELLCTAGFPMVFTRVLTLNDLSNTTYYGYIGLYNVIYVIPLLIIVGVFVWTLGSRKLSETEGRFLKLMSGTMMLGLGLMLLIKPDLLENMLAAMSIMGFALLMAFAVSLVERHRKSDHAPKVKTG